MSEAPAPAAPAKPLVTASVDLVEPIERQDSRIERLTLRKPKAGEMRGIKLSDLLASDVGAVLTLLPRITDPFITDAEAAQLGSEDIAEIAGTIFGFFMTPLQKALVAEMTGQSPSMN